MAKPQNGETIQFSVTLPTRACEFLEELAGLGLHGVTRGEVARTLILSRLEELAGKGMITITRRANERATTGAEPDSTSR